jgi:hypothetical protein
MLILKMILFYLISWYGCGVATKASVEISYIEGGPYAVWLIVAAVLTLVAAVLF